MHQVRYCFTFSNDIQACKPNTPPHYTNVAIIKTYSRHIRVSRWWWWLCRWRCSTTVHSLQFSNNYYNRSSCMRCVCVYVKCMRLCVCDFVGMQCGSRRRLVWSGAQNTMPLIRTACGLQLDVVFRFCVVIIIMRNVLSDPRRKDTEPSMWFSAIGFGLGVWFPCEEVVGNAGAWCSILVFIYIF